MKFGCIILMVALACASCKKEHQNSLNLNKEIAKFDYASQCEAIIPKPGNYVDSVLIFVNKSYLSDTSNPNNKPTVTFKWNFGDMSTSTDRNPTHKYSKTGVYNVSLYTYLDNQLSDSTIKQLQIVMGLREFKISDFAYVIDGDEAAEKGSIILFAMSNPASSNYSYGIYGVDSVLHEKWIKQIPGDMNSVRLSSLKRTNDNGYILSGNYSVGNINQFCLSKIDTSGNVIWVKYMNNLAGTNMYTTQVSDGGYLTIGDSYVGQYYGTAVVKCDGNGNEVWRKTYDTAIRQLAAANIIETDSGYVFASLSTDIFPNIVLTQLDFNGNITRQTSRTPDYPVSRGRAGVAYANNIFFVYPTNPGIENYVYFFNKDFSFNSSPYFIEGSVGGSFIDNGHFGFYADNNQYAIIGLVESNGTIDWQYTVDPVIYTSCTSLIDGVGRTCRKAIYSSSSEIIAFVDGQNLENTRSLYVVKLTPDGKIK